VSNPPVQTPIPAPTERPEPDWDVKFQSDGMKDVDPATEGDQPGVIVTGWTRDGQDISLACQYDGNVVLHHGEQKTLRGGVSTCRVAVGGMFLDVIDAYGGVLYYAFK